MVAPAALTRAVAPLFAFYPGRIGASSKMRISPFFLYRPAVKVPLQGGEDGKRGASVKELGDRRDAANCANGRHGWFSVVLDLPNLGCLGYALKAVIYRLKTQHPTLRLFQRCRW